MRKGLIATLVTLHFLIGSYCVIPPHYLIAKIPVLSKVSSVYHGLLFNQSWAMFAPPPSVNSRVMFAVWDDKGLGPLIEPFREIRESTEASFIIPRGATRVLVLLRSTNGDNHLANTPLRQIFYEQLGNYYCSGDGSAEFPGIKGIRFYIQHEGMGRFYESGSFGEPLPKVTDYDGVVPVFERDCLARR